MSLDTGLSNPVFNVLKYFTISVFLEAIVRAALDHTETFFRALHLHHGRPVSLNPSRIDRYNLSFILRSRKLPGLLFCVLLAVCAYSIEILLEFSSDAKENQFPISDTLELYQPTHPACTTSQLDFNSTMDLVIDMARTCVVVTDDKYTFYNVSWQRQGSSAPFPVCIHTRNNVLREGPRIYKHTSYANGTREERSMSNFDQTLRAHSWQSNGNRQRYTVTLSVTSADVESVSSYTEDGRNFTRAVLLTQVGTTDIRCVCTAFGRHGDGYMSLVVVGCFRDIPQGRNSYQVLGTALVEVDAKFVDSRPWNTTSNVSLGKGVYNFTSGVVDNRDLEGVKALTMLLSYEFSVEADAINKYAVVYKHCSDYLVPQFGDMHRLQTFENAKSERRVTISVAVWALIILLVWPSLLSFCSLAFHLWGKKKNFPMYLQGEGDIGRRWMSRLNESSHFTSITGPALRNMRFLKLARSEWLGQFRRPIDVFLNVEKGETEDDIVVSQSVLHVDRDVSHAFRKIG